MKLSFTKWVGTGNDFILFDFRRKKSFPTGKWAALAQKLCDRKRNIGGDGILVLESSKGADFRMRIFNPDGSEAEMCGNGSRCVAAHVAGGKNKDLVFDTLAGRLEARVRKDVVKVRLMQPHSFQNGIALDIGGKSYSVHSITVGVPHAVIFADDLEGIDVERLGEKVRNHSYFSPRGTNVDFVKAEGNNSIALRTYERGVEGETLACGTGAVASALVTALLKQFSSPVNALTKGGDRLKIYFRREGETFKDVYLEGKVLRVFEGSVKNV